MLLPIQINELLFTVYLFSLIASVASKFYQGGHPDSNDYCMEKRGGSDSNVVYYLKGKFCFTTWIILWRAQSIPSVPSPPGISRPFVFFSCESCKYAAHRWGQQIRLNSLLWNDDHIAISIKFQRQSCDDGKENLLKLNILYVRSLLLCSLNLLVFFIFSFSWLSSCLLRLARSPFLTCDVFGEKPTIWWKTSDENDVRRYPQGG